MKEKKMRSLLVLSALALSGCQSFTSINAEWEHKSDPMRGVIFMQDGAEDVIDSYGLIARWEDGRVYTEMGLGYQPTNQGFEGSGMIFTSKVGVKLWSKN
jgi:hypothetical protein